MSKEKIYIIENLDCANCAAKMERLIQAMPEVDEASLTFATKQLRVSAEDPDALVPEMLLSRRPCPHHFKGCCRSRGFCIPVQGSKGRLLEAECPGAYTDRYRSSDVRNRACR